MTKEKKQEYTLRISSANRTELVEILYEMLLDYTKEAEEAVEKGEAVTLKESVRKAKGCVSRLIDSVALDNDLANNFMSLYKYVIRELTLGDIRFDRKNFENVQKVVQPLKDTYLELIKTDKSAPIMTNTQTVVAGLTYSKNDINEALNENEQRGFYV